MTVSNALQFIDRGLEDSALRKRLNIASSSSEINDILADEKLLFSGDEFAQAFYQQLTECKETENADRLKEFKMWWDLLLQLSDLAGCESQCVSCCPG